MSEKKNAVHLLSAPPLGEPLWCPCFDKTNGKILSLVRKRTKKILSAVHTKLTLQSNKKGLKVVQVYKLSKLAILFYRLRSNIHDLIESFSKLKGGKVFIYNSNTHVKSEFGLILDLFHVS